MLLLLQHAHEAIGTVIVLHSSVQEIKYIEDAYTYFFLNFQRLQPYRDTLAMMSRIT